MFEIEYQLICQWGLVLYLTPAYFWKAKMYDLVKEIRFFFSRILVKSTQIKFNYERNFNCYKWFCHLSIFFCYTWIIRLTLVNSPNIFLWTRFSRQISPLELKEYFHVYELFLLYFPIYIPVYYIEKSKIWTISY